jgi:hypothetical protein
MNNTKNVKKLLQTKSEKIKNFNIIIKLYYIEYKELLHKLKYF